jgi:DNA-binding response OmpR family regulator
MDGRMPASPIPAADILVVDDNPTNCELLRAVLEGEGHRVHVAGDGPSALRAALSMPFDLALLDVRMPGMNGYELCERLKADPRLRGIPVIFLSALDDAANKVQGFDSGGADYIVKPFKVPEVLARVAHQLRNASLHREMHAKNEELRRRNVELSRSRDEANETAPSGRPSFLPPAQALELFDGKYKLEALIGHGGFGEVYRATHAVLHRPVALKLLRPGQPITSEDAARFRLEGISACRVDHPNAVAIWDAGVTQQGVFYLVMELLTGRSLRAEMQERAPLSVVRCVRVARAVCDVLAAAHAAGVIHRDIKPDNIFLHTPREGTEIVKVVDFGIAKLVGSVESAAFTAQGSMIGTPEYLAPERLQTKDYDGRSDIYGLGCTMFEMLTGQPPFVADRELPWLVAAKHMMEPPPKLAALNPRVPPEVVRAVEAALEKRPEDRPAALQMRELLDAIDLAALGPEQEDEGEAAPHGGVPVSTEAPTLLDRQVDARDTEA